MSTVSSIKKNLLYVLSIIIYTFPTLRKTYKFLVIAVLFNFLRNPYNDSFYVESQCFFVNKCSNQCRTTVQNLLNLYYLVSLVDFNEYTQSNMSTTINRSTD